MGPGHDVVKHATTGRHQNENAEHQTESAMQHTIKSLSILSHGSLSESVFHSGEHTASLTWQKLTLVSATCILDHTVSRGVDFVC